MVSYVYGQLSDLSYYVSRAMMACKVQISVRGYQRDSNVLYEGTLRRALDFIERCQGINELVTGGKVEKGIDKYDFRDFHLANEAIKVCKGDIKHVLADVKSGLVCLLENTGVPKKQLRCTADFFKQVYASSSPSIHRAAC